MGIRRAVLAIAALLVCMLVAQSCWLRLPDSGNSLDSVTASSKILEDQKTIPTTPTIDVAVVNAALDLVTTEPEIDLASQNTPLPDEFADVTALQTPTKDLLYPRAQVVLEGEEDIDFTLVEKPHNIPTVSEIGLSANGNPIIGHRLGSGDIHLVLVGGIHGGYEWNTILLAEKMVDYFRSRPDLIPSSVTIHIVPNANPDGLYAVTGKIGEFTLSDIVTDTVLGRFNGNGVDLNRNWGCRWTSTAVWRDQAVSGGAYPFSEPETSALKNFIIRVEPALVLFWHSAANGIYVGGCPVADEASHRFALLYGQASGYPVYTTFDHYEVTGDASDWLTTQGIPSISVELISHDAIDWDQNLSGVVELLSHYRSAAK